MREGAHVFGCGTKNKRPGEERVASWALAELGIEQPILSCPSVEWCSRRVTAVAAFQVNLTTLG